MIPIDICVLSYQIYTSELPNVDYKSSNKVIGHGNGCADYLNCQAMRWDFKRANYKWTTELCNQDSDGDGQSNGLELGDPNCVWSKGSVPEFITDISNPSDATSITLRQIPYLSLIHISEPTRPY